MNTQFVHTFVLPRFNDDGRRCRQCATAPEKLAEIGLVDGEVAKQFREWEEGKARKWGSKFPAPRVRGRFYEW